jgi:hypothetical protein
MPEPTKVCARCSEVKPEAEWAPSQWRLTGRAWCRTCYRDWHRARYAPKTGADDSPRTCSWCGESYRPKQRRPSKFCSRACAEANRKASGRARNGHLQRKYGITQEVYDTLLTKQGGGCAICGKTAAEQTRYRNYLHVDHDHETGLLRGLLCDRHNLLLGQFGDNADDLAAALRYLKKPPTSI